VTLHGAGEAHGGLVGAAGGRLLGLLEDLAGNAIIRADGGHEVDERAERTLLLKNHGELPAGTDCEPGRDWR